MRELPILAKDSVALNIRSGKQIQHRVPIKFPVIDRDIGCELAGCELAGSFEDANRNAPWNVGDLLYVRECSALGITDDGTQCIVFRADRTARAILSEYGCNRSWDEVCGLGDEVTPWEGVKWKYRPNILVPKTCARTWVKVNRVWVERIQDISISDAINEGVFREHHVWHDPEFYLPDVAYRATKDGDYRWSCPKQAFESLWNSIYGTPKEGKPDYSWNANPWVWACEFERVER